MASAINIPVSSLVIQEANAQGVPPAIALAVAQKESSLSQWTKSGGLVTGSAGEIGVFQLMPGTAASLGVDPTDLTQNIQGGITFLAQLYQKYGDWAKALSAYNSGSPTGSPSYASSVLAIAGSVAPAVPAPDLSVDSGDSSGSGLTLSTPVTVGLILGGIALAWWALD